jgi:antitoxin MazE
MIVQFTRWGNSLALRIPNAFAREISAEEGKQADLRVEGKSLVVTPVGTAPNYDLDALLDRIEPGNIHGEIATGRAVGREFG